VFIVPTNVNRNRGMYNFRSRGSGYEGTPPEARNEGQDPQTIGGDRIVGSLEVVVSPFRPTSRERGDDRTTTLRRRKLVQYLGRLPKSVFENASNLFGTASKRKDLQIELFWLPLISLKLLIRFGTQLSSTNYTVSNL